MWWVLNSKLNISVNFIKIWDMFFFSLHLITSGSSRHGLKLYFWPEIFWGSIWTWKEHFQGVLRWNNWKKFFYLCNKWHPNIQMITVLPINGFVHELVWFLLRMSRNVRIHNTYYVDHVFLFLILHFSFVNAVMFCIFVIFCSPNFIRGP